MSGQKSGMAVETLLLTIQSGTVTLVPAVVDADIAEVPPDEIDYNAPTPVSRERVAAVPDLSMVDPSNSVTLLVPARQLRKMTSVSFEEMVHDAWMSPTAVELNIPTAIVKARKMQAEGRTLVTRERSTSGTLIPPCPSRYIKFVESSPVVPDPVLRDYLHESLTYSEYRDLAHLWQKYTEKEAYCKPRLGFCYGRT